MALVLDYGVDLGCHVSLVPGYYAWILILISHYIPGKTPELLRFNPLL